MDSPQHRCAPHTVHSSGRVAPINLGLPLHAPQPAPGNNPFLAPFAPAPAPAPAIAPAPVVHNDPFLGPPAFAPVVYGGQQYNHLPAALAQQLAAIPPVPAPINLGLPLHAPLPAPGNDPFLAPPAPAPAVYNGHQYNHLPAALAQQLAAMPPAPVHRGRGRGRGRGQGPQAHPHPNVVPPAIFPPAQGNAPAPAAMVC